MKSPAVFISHSTRDRTLAGLVCQALEQRRIRCWIAPRDIGAGEIWDDAIANGIKSCQVVILIFSSGTNESVHVKREIHLAFDKAKLVIPFRVEDVKPGGGLEYMMVGVQWLDAVVPPLEHHLKVLADSVEAIIAAAEARSAAAEPVPGAKQPPDGTKAQAEPELASPRAERDAELDFLHQQLLHNDEKLKHLEAERHAALEAERKRQEEAARKPPPRLVSDLAVALEPEPKPNATETSPIPLSNPVASAELSVPPSPVVAEISCTKCGFPVIAGKRFCAQCGQFVAKASPPLESAAAFTEKAAPTPPNPSEPTQVYILGHKVKLDDPVSVVEEHAPLARVDMPPQVPGVAGSPAAALVDEPAAGRQPPPMVVERPVPPQEEPEPAASPIGASAPKPVATVRPVPTLTPKANDFAAPNSVDATSPIPISSWRLPALVAVAALCTSLGAMAGGFWWHTTHGKATLPSVAVLTPATVATPTPAPGSATAANGAVVSDRPTAAKPRGAVAKAGPPPLPVPPKSVIKALRVNVGDKAPRDMPVASLKMGSAVSRPQPPSREPTVPATPTSGKLHYSGPPVHYGESIVFPKLPPNMLRFTFDHQSWRPLISRRPDGTQTLTLTSIRQGEGQTQCDVGWEILR